MKKDFRPAMTTADDGSVLGMFPCKTIEGRGAPVFRMIGENHTIGSAERCHGFTQPTVGKKITKDIGATGIDEHDVEIPMQPTMLEAIIKDDAIERPRRGLESAENHAGPVGTDENRDTWKTFLIFTSFIRSTGGPGTVPPQSDGRLPPSGDDCLCDSPGERSLAGAANGEIAHGNDRNRNTGASSQTVPEMDE